MEVLSVPGMNGEGIRLSDGNMLIVKGRFKSNSMNLYGQFIIFFNSEGRMDTYSIIISTYSDTYNLEPHAGWEKYEEFIADLKWKGHFYTSMTASLMDSLNRMAEESRIVGELFSHTYNYDYDKMELILHDTINRIVHDKNLIMETGIQEVTREEYRSARSSNPPADDADHAAQDQGDRDTERGSVILTVKPILAPVNGKPLYSLRIGDRIMVRILPNTDRANYYIDVLGLRDDKTVRPAPGEVIDIKAGKGKNDPVEILTELGPGIFGKFFEEENQVKLRIYDPRIDGALSGAREPEKKGFRLFKSTAEGGYSIGTVVMLLLFALILVLLIILIFISL